MTQWNIQNIVIDLQQARNEWRAQQKKLKVFGGRELPSKEEIKKILNDLCGILFPMRLGPHDLRQQSENFYIAHTLEKTLYALLEQVKLNLSYDAKYKKQHEDLVEISEIAQNIVTEFAQKLPELRRLLDTDVIAAYHGDPAARSVDEVLLCYPGIMAIIYHRIAHEFYKKDLSLLARLIAEISHSKTGIDIHPGAEIDEGFFIDHETGVVIGETCIIGKNVRIYQAVTLGAKRFEVDGEGRLQKEYARHPIVEDNVVIYAGATILGRITIGQGAVIGGNVWITQSVPANSAVSQSSATKSKV
ncbi:MULTISPECIES: serine O-acetyltransferase EpsC [unclassified Acinetobacter]|uniref:serine O-acetyltransferase EpsC n=1 Tax=unclassified Acinetobacter TaxID=196816 RepID=UPI0025759490|nr:MULTISPECIES: serine O-acetyltransferase EpsC [unclassified Acinetobacter]MDM1763166.1 serine acetyltransferase [Acinetobacter sp. 226-1]MDM1766645.1 serine acetyltransferase [Acinetobacter sp. 226-4]